MIKEYGGFLPLELNNGEEYYTEKEYKLIRYNSIKAALCYIIKKIQPTQVYVPVFYCQSTTKLIMTCCNVKFYHVNEQLVPIDLPDDSEGIAIILVDYFGIRNSEVKTIANRFVNATVIIDEAHNFFSEPVIKKNVFNLYSAKKFFGIPDGAYLISEDLTLEEVNSQSFSTSELYNDYLITSYEKGTNAAYKSKKAADMIIADNHANMSLLAMGILKNVNYNTVKETRASNFRVLHESFIEMNALDIDTEADYPVYHYPLMIYSNNDAVNKIRTAIISEKIYSPVLWKGEYINKYGTDIEANLSNRLIFIPIDQRYNNDDMLYMLERIYHYINEYT